MKLFNFDLNLNFPFIKSVFSEPDGTGSCSRVLIASIIFFIIGAGTSLAFRIHQPVTVTDLCTFLGAGGTFITMTVAPLYLINKGADAINKNTESKGTGGQ